MIPRQTRVTKGGVLLVLSALLVGIQLFGGVPSQIAAAIGSILVLALAFAANARYLSALLLLCVPSYGIRTIGEGPYPLYFPELVSNTPVLGLEWSAGLALMAGALARVLFEFAITPSTFRFGARKLWVAGFLVALAIALYGAVAGYLDGYNRATAGVRAVLALGGYFWALILVRRTNWEVAEFADQMNIIVLASAFLIGVGLLRGHINFLLFGLFGGLLVYWFIRKRWISVALGTIGFGFGLLGTLTTAAIPLAALSVSLVIFLPWFRMRRFGVRSWVIGVAVAAFSGVAIGTVHFSQMGYGFLGAEAADDLGSYAAYKLYADRGPLWSGAVDVIRSGPYVFVPSGRPVRPAQEFAYRGIEEWRAGAHNAVLELFVNVGFVAGVWGLAFMLFVLWNLTAVASGAKNGVLRGSAAGVLGVAVIGSATGNFPVQDVGFLIWALAGWAVAVRSLEDGEVREFSARSRQRALEGERPLGAMTGKSASFSTEAGVRIPR